MHDFWGVFNKTIIPFTLVGYGTGYLPSHIQRALMEELLSVCNIYVTSGVDATLPDLKLQVSQSITK